MRLRLARVVKLTPTKDVTVTWVLFQPPAVGYKSPSGGSRFIPICLPGEFYPPNMTRSVVSDTCRQHPYSVHELHDSRKRDSTQRSKRRTTGILIRTSFLKIGVLESKSEAEMPMPMPHHARVPFQARIACSHQKSFHRRMSNQKEGVHTYGRG